MIPSSPAPCAAPGAADEALLAGLLPPGLVVLRQVWIAAGPWPLHADEQAAMWHAVPQRRAEFAAGRHCARAALLALCGAAGAVRMGPDRAPVWPPSVVGSITHDDGLCAAAVALRSHIAGLGIDIDRIERLNGDLEASICTPAERERWLQGCKADERQRRLASLFCIKEAVYKAQYPRVRAWLDFADLEVTLPDGLCGTFVATLQRAVAHWPAGHGFRGRCAVSALRSAAALVLLPGEVADTA